MPLKDDQLVVVGAIPESLREKMLLRSKSDILDDLIRCAAESRSLEWQLEQGEEVIAYQRCPGGEACTSSMHYHKVRE